MPQRLCRLFHVDAFTRERFCGNPAVVVLDADELTDEDMHRIAREINGTEIAFVLGSEAPSHDVEIRFFSPSREVAFVGHATVAAHYVRALTLGVPKGKVRQKSGGGIVEVEVDGTAPDLRITVSQSPATFGPIIPENRQGPVLDALGISSSSLHASCPLQVMSRASTRLMIGLQSPAMLESLRPQMESLVHLTPHVGADGFFVFALDAGRRAASDRVAHVLPGHRRARRPGQWQRARHAGRVPAPPRLAVDRSRWRRALHRSPGALRRAPWHRRGRR
jgi:PhzF family phenazine biosynthesis protein